MHQDPASILPVPLPTSTAGEIGWALAWFAVLAWCIWRLGPREGQSLFSPSAKNSPLRMERRTLLLLFALKVAAGVAHGLIYYHFYRTGDAVHHFQDARKLWTLMPENPLGYLHLLFGYTADGQAPAALAPVYDLLRGSWRTTEYFAVRLHGVFNLFTGAHYYANIVLFNGLLVLGLQRLYQAFARAWPPGARSLILPLCLLPSTLFWCSALHKDAMALLALGLLLFSLIPDNVIADSSGRLVRRAPSPIRWRAVNLLLAFFILSQTRPYLLWLLLPNLAVLAMLLRALQQAQRAFWVRHPWAAYALANVLAVCLMASLGALDPRLDLLERMAFETAFLQELRGNALLDMPPPANTLGELLGNLPGAMRRVLWGPIAYPKRHLLLGVNAVLSAAQLLGLLALLCLGWRQRIRRRQMHEEAKAGYNTGLQRALIGFGVFAALGVFLLVGLTVPQLGAIVRYKSALLPLLFAAVWMWARLAEEPIVKAPGAPPAKATRFPD